MSRPGEPYVRWGEGWQFGSAENDADMRDTIYANGRIFMSDAEALAFVQRRAEEGSEYHMAVIAFLIAQRMTE